MINSNTIRNTIETITVTMNGRTDTFTLGRPAGYEGSDQDMVQMTGTTKLWRPEKFFSDLAKAEAAGAKVIRETA